MDQSIRELFLTSFVKAVIESIRIPEEIKEKPKPLIEIKRFENIEDFQKSKQIMSEPAAPSPIQRFMHVMPKRLPIKMQRIDSPSIVERTMLDKNKQVIQNIEKDEQFQKSVMDTPQKTDELSLTKIKPFLYDPSVSSIECTGPDKPIIISKSGLMQTTSVTLTQPEITQIVEEVSNKTRIPIVLGSFKAAFGNFIMTAVISNFVGTRFLIQKKNLQGPLPHPQAPISISSSMPRF